MHKLKECKYLMSRLSDVYFYCPDLLSIGVKNEGWFDPWSLLVSFRKKAHHLGVSLLDGNVVGMVTEDDCVKHVKVCLLLLL